MRVCRVGRLLEGEVGSRRRDFRPFEPPYLSRVNALYPAEGNSGQTFPAAAGTALSYGTSSTSVTSAYSGYDRFGRIVETRWKTGSTDQVHSK